MPEESTATAASRIHELCNELAAQQGVEPAHREEICSHLAEKLLGYLAGEVKISEDDALLLVRAHFGDARGIARQLAGKPSFTPLPLRRRRTFVQIAVAAALLTLIGVPACVLLTDAGITSLDQVVFKTLLMIGSLGVLESGVFLAVRADPQSRCQRLIAAMFLAPVLGLGVAAILSALHRMAAGSIYIHAGDVGMSIVVIGSLVAHLCLLALLVMPAAWRGGRNPDPVVAG